MAYGSRLALLISLGMAIPLAGCASNANNVVSVDGTNISRAELDTKLEAGPAGKQTLTQIVQGDLVDEYAKANNITISDADVAKKEDEVRSKYPPGQFETILKQQGLTEDDVKRILRQQITIEQAVGKQVTVSDAAIKAYFDKNHAQFDKPEQVRAKHILVADLKTANDVEAKLKAGGDFAALAKQYSTDPSNKDKGGELGFFGKGAMVPPFQDAAFSQPIGVVGKPVKSPFGYHIIVVEERHPATKATLASAHDQIVDVLKQQQMQQQVPAFLQSLRDKAHIVVYDQRFSDLFPPPVAPPSAAGSAPAPAPSTK